LFDKAMTTLLQFPQGKMGVYSIPEGIISIRSDAFFDDCKLTGISFPQSFLFTGISFPDTLFIIINFPFDNDQLTDITVNEFHPKYCSIDGVLFDKKIKELIIYPKNKDRTNYIVPDGVIIINATAFYGCKRLINIVLPESLKIIDAAAFENCDGFKAITLPMSLQYIGEKAFQYCSNLETVTLSRKTRIGYKAFEGFTGQFVYRD